MTEWARPVVNARCCRVWLVFPMEPIGRCGICGERPTIIREEEPDAGYRG